MSGEEDNLLLLDTIFSSPLAEASNTASPSSGLDSQAIFSPQSQERELPVQRSLSSDHLETSWLNSSTPILDDLDGSIQTLHGLFVIYHLISIQSELYLNDQTQLPAQNSQSNEEGRREKLLNRI